MPHSYGYRSQTRYAFARGFRKHGTIKLSTYMREYRVGDWVDIKVNGAVHKGMPHKTYHGRTGRVYMVTPNAVGVMMAKRVRHRYMRKFITARIEHVRHNYGQIQLAQRRAEEVKYRQSCKQAMKARGAKPEVPDILKPKPPKRPYPRQEHLVKAEGVLDVDPLPHEIRL